MQHVLDHFADVQTFGRTIGHRISYATSEGLSGWSRKQETWLRGVKPPPHSYEYMAPAPVGVDVGFRLQIGLQDGAALLRLMRVLTKAMLCSVPPPCTCAACAAKHWWSLTSTGSITPDNSCHLKRICPKISLRYVLMISVSHVCGCQLEFGVCRTGA